MRRIAVSHYAASRFGSVVPSGFVDVDLFLLISGLSPAGCDCSGTRTTSAWRSTAPVSPGATSALASALAQTVDQLRADGVRAWIVRQAPVLSFDPARNLAFVAARRVNDVSGVGLALAEFVAQHGKEVPIFAGFAGIPRRGRVHRSPHKAVRSEFAVSHWRGRALALLSTTTTCRSSGLFRSRTCLALSSKRAAKLESGGSRPLAPARGGL